MKVLVTGSEGYIGSVLMPKLKKNGYEITGYDICFYKNGLLTNENSNDYHLIEKDIRDVEENDLIGFDAIIHLAALSNDPLGKINEKLTYDINYEASLKLAKLAKKAKVKKFIFASSCSLYGASNNRLTEDDISNPQTVYGKSKILTEKAISKLADKTFSPTFMRNATAFGISSRMRFDIVVNNLTGFAHTIQEIKMLSDGKAWRPLVHVNDICDAMITVLEAPKNIVYNQAFNVGDNIENYQVKDIALNIQKIYKQCELTFQEGTGSSDSRNYNVCFDKLNNILGYKCKVSLEDGINEIKKVYEEINLNNNKFEDKYFTRLKQILYLIENNFIDNNLRVIKGSKDVF